MRVGPVRVKDVDVVRAEAIQTGLRRPDKVTARQPGTDERVTRAETGLGADDDSPASSRDDAAEQFLALPLRIDVRSVEEVDASVQAVVR